MFNAAYYFQGFHLLRESNEIYKAFLLYPEIKCLNLTHKSEKLHRCTGFYIQKKQVQLFISRQTQGGGYLTRFWTGTCHRGFKNIPVPYTNFSKMYTRLYTKFSKTYTRLYTNFPKMHTRPYTNCENCENRYRSLYQNRENRYRSLSL